MVVVVRAIARLVGHHMLVVIKYQAEISCTYLYVVQRNAAPYVGWDMLYKR